MKITVSSITAYGKQVQIKLVEKSRTQAWLIDEVRKRTGLFFDGSYLYKVLVGKAKSAKIIEAINEILGITET